jgi:Transposase IS116/IS110/IS902 family
MVAACCAAGADIPAMHGEVLMEEQDGQPVSRRLVGIDLGIASRHSVRVLEADGQVVCRASCVPTVVSLALVESAALAGAPEGTKLAVVFGPTGPAWMPIAVFFARRGHRVYRVSSAKAADLRRFLAEVGDGSAFTNGSKLAAYAGLAPVTRQSGTSPNAETRSRRGNHQLKNAIFLAAFASLRDPASKTFYDRKRAEGKRHNAALICVARRRCDVILAMLRTGHPYQPTRPAPSLAEAA